jgi:hypothetical protein
VLTAFKKEGQAQILTEYWKAGHGYHEDKKGVPFSTPGYVENLRQLVKAPESALAARADAGSGV